MISLTRCQKPAMDPSVNQSLVDRIDEIFKNNNSQDFELKVKEVANLYFKKLKKVNDVSELDETEHFINLSKKSQKVQKILLEECGRVKNSSWTKFSNNKLVVSVSHLISMLEAIPSYGQGQDSRLEVKGTQSEVSVDTRCKMHGGMLGTNVMPPRILLAMRQGDRLSSGQGSPHVTNLTVQIKEKHDIIEGDYSGEMKKVKMEGRFFKQWLPDGEGRVQLSNGTFYKGSFLLGQFSKGRLENSDGSYIYEGTWNKGKRSEYGCEYVLHSQNGKRMKRYEGFFKNDQYHGEGTKFLENGKKQHGLWERDQLKEEQLTPAEEEVSIKNLLTVEMVLK
jgi:hypothetical protein